MTTITLTRHELSSSALYGLARKERRPWIQRRIRAIGALAEGAMSREAIARRFHTDSDQMRLWIRRYNAKGLYGLEDKLGRGAKRTMTPRQEAFVRQALQKSPRASGINANLWTGRAVQEYVAKQHWFSCSISASYVLIHCLGFTLQCPERSPIEADPARKEQFFAELREKKRI